LTLAHYFKKGKWDFLLIGEMKTFGNRLLSFCEIWNTKHKINNNSRFSKRHLR